MPDSRSFKVRVLASVVPEQVTVNGKQATFSYDGNELALTVEVPETNCSVEKNIEITYPKDALDVSDGLYAQLRHVELAVRDLKMRDAGIVLTEDLGTMESTGRSITYYPSEFKQRIETFRKNYSNLPEVLKGQKLSEANADWFLNAVK